MSLFHHFLIREVGINWEEREVRGTKRGGGGGELEALSFA